MTFEEELKEVLKQSKKKGGIPRKALVFTDLPNGDVLLVETNNGHNIPTETDFLSKKSAVLAYDKVINPFNKEMARKRSQKSIKKRYARNLKTNQTCLLTF